MPAPYPFHILADCAEMGASIEAAALAVGRLDSRISGSSQRQTWHLRASWTGFARALQLSGVEIDEIDVFSWGVGASLPGRPKRNTLTDPYAAFPAWRERLARTGRHWAEDLPFTLDTRNRLGAEPRLIRAFDLLAQWLQVEPGLGAWLALPILLHRLGVSGTPLPCLVAGDRRLRSGARDPAALLRGLLRALADRADEGLAMHALMERTRAQALATLQEQRRPGALGRLTALMQVAPLQTPEAVSRRLRLTLSGSGKLLQRAAELGLVHEISQRRSWRVYLTPDLAQSLGFVAAPRGRPPLLPTPTINELGKVLVDFDREMAAWDTHFGASTDSSAV